MGKRSSRRLPAAPVTIEIEGLDHAGRGVGRLNDKLVLVHGALAQETVEARLIARNRGYDEGLVTRVDQASPERVEPECPWFHRCGGCALQHLEHASQLRYKHQRLVDDLQRIGGVMPEHWLEPLTAEVWQYRRRARLSARWVAAKARVLVGFREQQGGFVADIQDCRILHPDFSQRLQSLSELLTGLSVADAVPQIEIACGDTSAAMVIRHLRALNADDRLRLKAWSQDHSIAVYLQPKGPDSVHRLWPEQHRLFYRLPAFELELDFHPQHFIQVNAGLNQRLVQRVVELLAPQSHERVLDLFCGLGNFTLPLARRAGQVTGVEGSAQLIAAAQANAQSNGIENLRFDVADLTEDVSTKPWFSEQFDAALIDPPRSGALEILPLIAASGARRLVYVSCNPTTLARDAAELVCAHGYRLISAGIADMFPHTAQMESLALFERESP